MMVTLHCVYDIPASVFFFGGYAPLARRRRKIFVDFLEWKVLGHWVFTEEIHPHGSLVRNAPPQDMHYSMRSQSLKFL
jgi:hypothetical protein